MDPASAGLLLSIGGIVLKGTLKVSAKASKHYKNHTAVLQQSHDSALANLNAIQVLYDDVGPAMTQLARDRILAKIRLIEAYVESMTHMTTRSRDALELAARAADHLAEVEHISEKIKNPKGPETEQAPADQTAQIVWRHRKSVDGAVTNEIIIHPSILEGGKLRFNEPTPSSAGGLWVTMDAEGLDGVAVKTKEQVETTTSDLQRFTDVTPAVEQTSGDPSRNEMTTDPQAILGELREFARALDQPVDTLDRPRLREIVRRNPGGVLRTVLDIAADALTSDVAAEVLEAVENTDT